MYITLFTSMAENEEELKSFLKRVKEESEKASLKPNIKKTKIMASCPIVLCLVTQSCPTLCDPVDCSQPGSSIHGNCPGKYTGVPCPPRRDLPNPGIKPKSSSLQVDSLPSEPPGKPKNTGVGSLSLPQGNFPT